MVQYSQCQSEQSNDFSIMSLGVIVDHFFVCCCCYQYACVHKAKAMPEHILIRLLLYDYIIAGVSVSTGAYEPPR